jgi:hypothetical protein
MNQYLGLMFFLWALIAWIVGAFFLDNPRNKTHLSIQALWFLIMGFPFVVKLWIAGVMT